MARTERGRYRFTVKEGTDGRFFLALEPAGEVIPAFGDTLLCLDLRDGTSHAHAKQIAGTLNDSVTSLSATFFDKKADA